MCSFNAISLLQDPDPDPTSPDVIADFVTPIRLYYLIVNAYDIYLSRPKNAHKFIVSNALKII